MYGRMAGYCDQLHRPLGRQGETQLAQLMGSPWCHRLHQEYLLELEIRCVDSVLLISVRISDDFDFISKIYNVLVALWKDPIFNDSRWLSIGKSASAIVIC